MIFSIAFKKNVGAKIDNLGYKNKNVLSKIILLSIKVCSAVVMLHYTTSHRENVHGTRVSMINTDDTESEYNTILSCSTLCIRIKNIISVPSSLLQWHPYLCMYTDDIF